LGFRNLHGFNLALLGKQGWKFIANQDVLVTRFFKARYFFGGKFLDARIGHNLSYVWKSIWNTQALLKKGF
ncbi:Putative mitochondrial protein, partial [Glycine soja]